jgi:antitoxin (DNA-binding transcriptional repressor) of toxin-antitoxin stability system
MHVVSLRVFRRNLTELAERAKDGEVIVVRRRNTDVAMLRAATEAEQLHHVGLGEMRFALGRHVRAVEHGKKWLVTFHGNPELIFTAAPAAQPTADRQADTGKEPT